MAVVYLMSTADFKAYTPVHANVDDKFIQQSILACQDMYVVEITGTDLYNKLCNDTPNVIGNYKILLQDYLHKGMRYWIMSELAQILNSRFTNIGYQEKYSEVSSPSDRLINDKNDFKNKAEYYANKTRLYLRANTTLFPEYLTNGSECDDVVPKDNMFKSSIYAGSTRKRNYPFPKFNNKDGDCY